MTIDLIIGSRGTGKTFASFSLLKAYKNNKFIVIDPHNEYVDLPEVKLKNLNKYLSNPNPKHKQVKIVFYSEQKNEYEKAVISILDKFEGALIIEDTHFLTAHFQDFLRKIDKYFQAYSRHSKCSLGLVFQNPSQISKSIMANLPSIRLHYNAYYQLSNLNCLNDSTKEIIRIAELIINEKHHQGNKFFYCYIDTLNKKIKGDITKTEYQSACLEYLIEKNGLMNYFN